MATKRRYSKEEFERRGDEVYATVVQPRLTADDHDKFAAVDIETGTYEIDANQMAACDRLRSLLPDAQIWLVRVGHSSLYRFGGFGERSA